MERYGPPLTPVMLRVMSSTGRAKVADWLAESAATWLETTSMSVRVNALTVIGRLTVNPPAAVAAGVFVTTRQRTVAEGTRFGRNRKEKLIPAFNRVERGKPSYWTEVTLGRG